MIKRILCLALAIVCIAGTAVIGVSAADADKIYFEVPDNWNNYSKVYCYIWNLDGSGPLVSWKSKKGLCEQVEDRLYSYDTTKAGGLQAGVNYGLIFVVDIDLQTYDALLTTACLGDTLYSDGTVYENPADSSKTCLAAFWRNQDPSKYGPIMQVTSIGNLIGTCIPSGTTAESMFTKFLNDNLTNARTYSGKDDQAIIDDVLNGLGLSQDTGEQLIKEAGVEVAWEKAQSVAPTVDTPVTPHNSGAVSSGQETTVVFVAMAMMLSAAAAVLVLRKKKAQ